MPGPPRGPSIRAENVRDIPWEVCARRGLPGHVRSSNGSGFFAKSLRRWITGWEGDLNFVAPGAP